MPRGAEQDDKKPYSQDMLVLASSSMHSIVGMEVWYVLYKLYM